SRLLRRQRAMGRSSSSRRAAAVLAGASPRASTVIGSRTPPYQTLSSPSFPRLAGAGPASPLPAAPTDDTATCAVYPEPTVSSIPSNISYAVFCLKKKKAHPAQRKHTEKHDHTQALPG